MRRFPACSEGLSIRETGIVAMSCYRIKKARVVLLVAINKQGKSNEHRFHDYFIDPTHFHWQSQNSTTPETKRGREMINQERLGIGAHLFVREHKLATGKAAPFRYFGPGSYQSHEGSAPLSIIWTLAGDNPHPFH